MTLRDFIEYIDRAFARQRYTSFWTDERGKDSVSDVGYAEEWWNACAKPELLRVFGGDTDDRP